MAARTSGASGSSSTSSATSTTTTSVPFAVAAAYSVLLVSYFWLALLHGRLIEDPVQSMIQSIPSLGLIQVGYCILGNHNEGKAHKNGNNKKGKKPSDQQEGYGSLISSAVLALILSFMMSILVYSLLVLFGAPYYSMGTFLCAVHISLLSVQPLVFVYNLDSNIWKDIISVKLPLNGVYGASVGTWFGAWLGAIPIPLDWDRPWQQWPITILGGAYLGTAAGTIVGALVRKCK